MKKAEIVAAIFFAAAGLFALCIGQGMLAPLCLAFALIPVFFEETERKTLRLRRWKKQKKSAEEKRQAAPAAEKKQAAEKPKPVKPKPETPSPAAQPVPSREVKKQDRPADELRQLRKIFGDINEWNQSIAYGIGFLPALEERYRKIGGADPADVLYDAYGMVWRELEAGRKPSRASLEESHKLLTEFWDTYQFEEISGSISQLAIYLSRTEGEKEADVPPAPPQSRWTRRKATTTDGLVLELLENGTASVIRYQGNKKTVCIPESFQGYRVVKICPDVFAEGKKWDIRVPASVTDTGSLPAGTWQVVTGQERPKPKAPLPEKPKPQVPVAEKQVISAGQATTPPKQPAATVPRRISRNNMVFRLTKNQTAALERYTGHGSRVNIPETVEGYPVVQIDADAFSDHYELTRVEIPSGVTYIGMGAFRNCGRVVKEDEDLSRAYGARSRREMEEMFGYGYEYYEGRVMSGEDPITVSYHLTVTVHRGSYAERYCRQNNISVICK